MITYSGGSTWHYGTTMAAPPGGDLNEPVLALAGYSDFVNEIG